MDFFEFEDFVGDRLIMATDEYEMLKYFGGNDVWTESRQATECHVRPIAFDGELYYFVDPMDSKIYFCAIEDGWADKGALYIGSPRASRRFVIHLEKANWKKI